MRRSLASAAICERSAPSAKSLIRRRSSTSLTPLGSLPGPLGPATSVRNECRGPGASCAPTIADLVEPVELSVVVPVYNEADSIEPFLARLLPVLREHVTEYEVIFAVDPGRDDTEAVIRRARVADPAVKMVVFSRRFGQPTATLAGIDFASGSAVVVMDVDLQDPPELIPEMLARWREGFEVVEAIAGSSASCPSSATASSTASARSTSRATPATSGSWTGASSTSCAASPRPTGSYAGWSRSSGSARPRSCSTGRPAMPGRATTTGS